MQAVLADYGISKIIPAYNEDKTAFTPITGTDGYRPPEIEE